MVDSAGFESTALRDSFAAEMDLDPAVVQLTVSNSTSPGARLRQRRHLMAESALKVVVTVQTDDAFLAGITAGKLEALHNEGTGALSEALGVTVEAARASVRGSAEELQFGNAIIAAGSQTTLEVDNCTFRELNSPLGGALAVVDGAVAVVRNSRFIGNRAKLGGAIYVDGGKLTLSNCTITKNSAEVEGGGIFMASGSTFIGEQTVLADNWAPKGSQASVRAGVMLYVMPAPLGRWVPSPFLCQVYRVPCPMDAPECEASAQPPLALQPCDALAHPELIGRMVSAFSLAPLDDAFPFQCSAGFQGTDDEPTSQSGPSCTRPCTGGYFCSGGTRIPSICPAGTYCSEGSASPTTCPAGTYSYRVAKSSISDCLASRPGFWAAAGFEVACPKGFYQEVSGATNEGACIRCPEHATTLKNASGTRADCICDAGHYAANASHDLVECPVCPVGTSCDAGVAPFHFDVTTLPVKRGYYRLSTKTVDVRRCPDAATNCTNLPECPESSSGCRGTVQPDATASVLGCHEGLIGVFCRKCDRSNATVRIYYSAATPTQIASCKQCGDLVAISILSGIGIVLVLMLLWSMRTRMYELLPQRRKTALAAAWTTFRPLVKLKILFAFYMVASRIGSVYEVSLPAGVMQLLNFFSVMVNLGLSELMYSTLECVGWDSYVYKVLFWMLVPVVGVTLIVLGSVGWLRLQAWRASSEHDDSQVMALAMPWVLRLLFIFFPIISNAVFEAWPCHKFEERQYLRIDVDIACNTAAHREAQAVAITALLIYPVGLLVLNGALLYCARRAILSEQPSPLSHAISFLHSEYEPQMCWWELVEMLKRLVLVGLMVLMQGSTMQLILGTLLALIFSLFQALAQPYRSSWDDYFACACSFSLVVLFLCAYAFKEAALVDLPDIQAKMSQEQMSTYVLDHALLTTVLFVSVISALLIASGIFSIQLVQEGKRLQTEAREAKARRLRYLQTEEVANPGRLPIVPAWLPSDIGCGPFHLFLSHNWKNGQAEMRIIKSRLREMMPEISVFLDVDALGVSMLKDYENVDVSGAVLCFCTRTFLKSGPCARELVRATLLHKPLLLLLQSDVGPDSEKGGLTELECIERISEEWVAEQKFRAGKPFYLRDQVAEWAVEWHQPGLQCPTASQVRAALFAANPIIWYYTSDFQDVTLRLIAERLLQGAKHSYGQDYQPTTFVQGEIAQRLRQPIRYKISARHAYHLYVSPHNPGAHEVAKEMQALTHTSRAGLSVTTDVAALSGGHVEMMFLYLNGRTWGHEGVEALVDEINLAAELGVRVVLAHETPGVLIGDEERYGCVFEEMIKETPQHAVHIYSSMIAISLAGAEWRQAGLVKLALTIARGNWKASMRRASLEVENVYTMAMNAMEGATAILQTGRSVSGSLDLAGSRRGPSLVQPPPSLPTAPTLAKAANRLKATRLLTELPPRPSRRRLGQGSGRVTARVAPMAEKPSGSQDQPLRALMTMSPASFSTLPAAATPPTGPSTRFAPGSVDRPRRPAPIMNAARASVRIQDAIRVGRSGGEPAPSQPTFSRSTEAYAVAPSSPLRTRTQWDHQHERHLQALILKEAAPSAAPNGGGGVQVRVVGLMGLDGDELLDDSFGRYSGCSSGRRSSLSDRYSEFEEE